MMISSKGRYALRVMTDMGRHQEEDYLSLNDIAERLHLSRKYLESIMTVLCKSGLVKSTVGKSGGYKLVRPAEAYTAGEILRAVEEGMTPVSCLAEHGKKCSGSCECDCDMIPFWQGLEASINTYLDSYTLRDLMNNKPSADQAGIMSEVEHHES